MTSLLSMVWKCRRDQDNNKQQKQIKNNLEEPTHGYIHKGNITSTSSVFVLRWPYAADGLLKSKNSLK